jgi:glycyl-tRNA synthetase beta subunit
VQPDTFTLPAETALWAAYQAAAAAQDGTVARLVAGLRPLVPAITAFFIDVLVMDEDMAVRTNRLALLQRIAHLPSGIADLSHLEGF